MLRVGLIGYGTAGKGVADAILSGRAGDSQLISILVRDTNKVENFSIDGCLLTDNEDQFFSRSHEVIIEVAGHDAVRRYAHRALENNSDFIVASAGAFCDQGLLDSTISIARTKGKRIIIPSAAIAGLDRIAAATQGTLDSVTLTTHKPVKAWKGTFAEEVVDLDTLTKPTLIFEGNARESSRLFPESVNVSAALSLAGIGFEATQVRVLADPTIDKNMHEVNAKGLFGEVSIQVKNTPSRQNPKTGYILAMSVSESLKRLSSPLIVG